MAAGIDKIIAERVEKELASAVEVLKKDLQKEYEADKAEMRKESEKLIKQEVNRSKKELKTGLTKVRTGVNKDTKELKEELTKVKTGVNKDIKELKTGLTKVRTGVNKKENLSIKESEKLIKQEVNKNIKELKEELTKVRANKSKKQVRGVIHKRGINQKEKETIEATFLNLQKEAEKNNEPGDILNKERLDKVVSYNLIRIRTEKNLTQKAVSDMSGVNYNTYHSMERGYGFSLETVFNIANSLGVTPSDLMTTD